jgi:predicted AAA+ superfamily ATPase
MYIPRAIESVVRSISDTFPVLLLTGPRQVGKTTLLKYLSEKDRSFVTLDDPLQRDLANTDPELFLDRFNVPLLIDEIQYAPPLLPCMKMRVDRSGRQGDFWLTGSQTFQLMQMVSEALSGRVGIVRLLGLSQAELTRRQNLPFLPTRENLVERRNASDPRRLQDLFTIIHRGSLPALFNAERAPDWEIFYASYVQTYLQRDIRDLSQVGDELVFLRFLTAVAARTAQILQYADLARDVGISQPTAKRWLSLLISSGLVILLEPWYNNRMTRLIKAPKIYFLDTGLAAYLTRWNSPQTLEAGAMSCAFFETFVVSEIVKSWYYAGKNPPLFYYRDKDQNEIDLLLERDGSLYPVEIKKTANPGKDSLKVFHRLAMKLEKAGIVLGPGAIVCCANEYLPLDPRTAIVPWWMV